MARMLAAKSAIGIRVDALSSWSAEGESQGDDIDVDSKSSMGARDRAALERKLRGLEGKPLLPRGVAVGPNGKPVATPGKWEIKEARKYNPDADGLAGNEPAASAPEAENKIAGKKEKKEKKKDKTAKIEDVTQLEDQNDDDKIKDEPANDSEEEEEEEDEEEDDADEEMADVDAGLGLPAPDLKNTKAKPITNGTLNGASGDHSDTLSTVSADTPNSPDSPTPQERNWQSEILGNTKEAKKARKVERHARKLAMSEEKAKQKFERNAKIERRLDRKARRAAKAEQDERREDTDEAKYGKLARLAGISVSKYKRKAERGEISIQSDGTPIVISKKDIKKQRKAEARTNGDEEAPKKRKRDDDEVKVEKRKKNKA